MNNSETVKPTVLATQSRLYRALFKDIAREFPALAYLLQDAEYLVSRMTKEGSTFCSITLPKLGKAIETALISEEPLSVPMGWELKKGSRLPKFLNQCLQMLFGDDGKPLYHFTIHPDGKKDMPQNLFRIVMFLRQICMAYSKVEATASDDLKNTSIKEFLHASNLSITDLLQCELQWGKDREDTRRGKTIDLSRVKRGDRLSCIAPDHQARLDRVMAKLHQEIQK